MKIRRSMLFLLVFLASTCVVFAQGDSHQKKQKGTWNFAVSGDSRNCGDIVMPAIAAGAIKNNAAFYWHLGDLRAIFAPDEDYLHAPEHRGQPVDMDQYLIAAWDDYIQNQVAEFGAMPVFIGIGNHETIKPKTRADYVVQFADWLDSPALQKQRLADNPKDHKLRPYFHWIQGGVDFIYLDNALLTSSSPTRWAGLKAC